MTRRLLKIAVFPLAAWLALIGLEHLARAQTTTGAGGKSTTSSGGFGSVGGSSIGTGASGASFSGAAGGTFSGGQGGFSGAQAGAGQGAARGGGAAGASGSSAVIPAASNLFSAHYANPMAKGLASATGATAGKAFGQPLYATTTTTGARPTGGTNTGAANSSSNVGFTTYGMLRDVPYTTELGEDLRVPNRPASALQTKVADVLKNTSTIKNRNGITVSVDGGTVTLKGVVASPQERRLLESQFWFEPGVNQVINELTVAANPKQ